jgi:hypothetical protein
MNVAVKTSQPQEALLDIYGVNIITVYEGGQIWVALKPIVEALGLDWSSQRSKINRLKEEGVAISPHPVKTNGGTQKMLFIRLEDLPIYLYSINISKVKPEIKPKLLKFKRETAEVIRNYWMNKFKQEEEQLEKLKAEYNQLVKELRSIPTYEEYKELKMKYDLLTTMIDMLVMDMERAKPYIDAMLTRIKQISEGIPAIIVENNKAVKKILKVK